VAARQSRSAVWALEMAVTLEARGGIEPPIKVLQTFALPLGDRAAVTCRTILSPRLRVF
jgi:hypothetical protein